MFDFFRNKTQPDKVLNSKIIDVLKTVSDPELPVNIYDLGLIYEICQAGSGSIIIRMTLTAPACPVAGTLPAIVEKSVTSLDEVDHCKVELVWDPPWTREKISEEGKLELDMY